MGFLRCQNLKVKKSKLVLEMHCSSRNPGHYCTLYAGFCLEDKKTVKRDLSF